MSGCSMYAVSHPYTRLRSIQSFNIAPFYPAILLLLRCFCVSLSDVLQYVTATTRLNF
ncbi:hypothetical protein BT96DRAFT_639618 [Gymnopus androsaceus JB14]|uniref:Uncharacterized protein n=1 Tax=Gymnopus androsaceus JB14 TaxID=1447944 RepID=A0A6A4HQD7_9AGAR|nr:hypothetical protein BT96DRAFT_639618 [Gymnopus androsaceus JB14]